MRSSTSATPLLEVVQFSGAEKWRFRRCGYPRKQDPLTKQLIPVTKILCEMRLATRNCVEAAKTLEAIVRSERGRNVVASKAIRQTMKVNAANAVLLWVFWNQLGSSLSFIVSTSRNSYTRHAFGLSRTTRWHPLFAEKTVDSITCDTKERMSKSIDSVRNNLTGIRTGRASTNILDRVKVDYYGASTPLNQLATISVASAQQLTVDPYDKSVVAEVEKAILESGIGVTPHSDGTIIRVNIPALTEERRKQMIKLCKAFGEEGKVALRNIRRDGVDGIKKLNKAKMIGEDEMQIGLEKIQILIDKRVKEIEEIVSKKEKDVMTV